MKVITSPESIVSARSPSIFLAGSIEMGTAENWQDEIITELRNICGTLFNPRRPDWNWEWEQSIDNDRFYEQVSWELAALNTADIIGLYFDPISKSPISLLELGLFAKDKKLIVCCPDGFWRKGNVQIVCSKYKIPFYNTKEAWIENLKSKLVNL